MQTALGILAAIFVFGIMIFLHELGHYLAARLCKVKVLEFAVGMGPKLISHTSKKTGIVYSLRALPIGGFTAMQGEDGEDPDPDALVNKPRFMKLLVLFAGSLFNIISGVLAMFVFLAITGQVGSNEIYNFRENSQSNQWLQPGDIILKIDNRTMLDYTDIANTITLDGTEPLDITVRRDEEEILLQDVTFPVVEREGVLVGDVDFIFLGVRPSIGTLLTQTGTQSVATVKMIYKTLIQLITGKLGVEGVSGPVGTVSIISEVATSSFVNLIYLFSFISLNLGVMNLLPIPALDGGRILFTLIECVTRKKLNPNVEGFVHFAGMVLLLLLMAIITVLDVLKFF